MHRFYIDRKIEDEIVIISDRQQLHHIIDVLRLKAGGEVTVFDIEGYEAACSIVSISTDAAVLAVKSKKLAGKRQISLTIACAIAKSGMDEIVDNLTQLGIDSIIPLETERVVVRLDEAKKQERVERWRRIALSAAEQSQRSRLPTIEPVAGLAYVLSRAEHFDLKLIPTLEGERKHLRDILREHEPKSILVLIGPEGDFTPDEVQLARNAGFTPVTLGDTVLRVSTAAIAVAAYINFSTE
jgi:16S rRNA (uracil1498-N3)-methyltransferase